MKEYAERMEVLAEEINSGLLRSNVAIGIKLHPPLVEWYANENMMEDANRYDGLFFVESLTEQVSKDAKWDGPSLAEYLENLTREFIASESD
jgi:hypothetical protein